MDIRTILRPRAFRAREDHKSTEEMTREDLIARIEYLEKEVGIDPLTGVANRRIFEEKLAHALEHFVHGDPERREERRQHLGLLMVDIDHFKEVNDTWTHLAGDAVLQKVAAALRKAVRDTDLVARYGGEEFTILMRGADEAQAGKKAEEIRKKIANLSFRDYPGLELTVSIGVTTTADAIGRDELVSCADRALYHAKNSGRDRVVIYSCI